MVYLLSLPFQTRGEPLFFLSNALREYSVLRFGLTIWPYGNTLFERGKVSFKCALSKAVFFFTSHAAEIAYFSSANRGLSNAIGVM